MLLSIASLVEAVALQATGVCVDCLPSNPPLAAEVNRSAFDLKRAMERQFELGEQKRVPLANVEKRDIRLPVVRIQGDISADEIFIESGVLISPCIVLTTNHKFRNLTEVKISTETDANGVAIKQRTGKVLFNHLMVDGGRLNVAGVKDETCEGGKRGFTKFIYTLAGNKKNQIFVAGFPYEGQGETFDGKTLFSSVCNTVEAVPSLVYHDCLMSPGSSGTALFLADSVLNPRKHKQLKVNLFYATGVQDLSAESYNVAFDGAIVDKAIRKIVEDDIAEYIQKSSVPSQNKD